MNNQQPPTREQIAEAIDTWWDGTDPDGVMAEDVEALTADLLALFQQPTPSAERTYESCGIHGMEFDDDCGWCWIETTAEPVSIADMAPGTTLVAALDSSYSDNRPFLYMIVRMPRGKRLVGTDGVVWSPDQFDPSTIRDVTSPKGVQ